MHKSRNEYNSFPYFELYNPIASAYSKLQNAVNIVYTSTTITEKKTLKLISVFQLTDLWKKNGGFWRVVELML